MDALHDWSIERTIWDARRRLNMALSHFSGTYGNSTRYSDIAMAPEVSKLLSIALLSGTNIAVDGKSDMAWSVSIIGNIAGIAPQFSKTAVVSKILKDEQRSFARYYLRGKHNVTCITESIAKEYGADILVCPFPLANMRKIMNVCRTRMNYIAVLDRSIGKLLKSRSIEGINSIDLLITPNGSGGSGFEMHELRWLSRAETDQGTDIRGEDMLEVHHIGTNVSLECDPESTKFVKKYSKIRGESGHAVWINASQID